MELEVVSFDDIHLRDTSRFQNFLAVENLSSLFIFGFLSIIAIILHPDNLMNLQIGVKELPVLWLLGCHTNNISDAISIVTRELDFTQRERDGFIDFIQQVKEVSTVSEIQPGHQAMKQITVKNNVENQNESILQIYQENIMSISSYNEIYGDSLSESFREEFGPEISSYLVSCKRFSPHLKQQLVATSKKCVHEREDFIQRLEKELRSLQSSKRTLDRIKSEFQDITQRPYQYQSESDLRSHRQIVKSRKNQCEEMLHSRQENILENQSSTRVRNDKSDLQSYLYQSLTVTFPILSDTVTTIEYLNHHLNQIELCVKESEEAQHSACTK